VTLEYFKPAITCL